MVDAVISSTWAWIASTGRRARPTRTHTTRPTRTMRPGMPTHSDLARVSTLRRTSVSGVAMAIVSGPDDTDTSRHATLYTVPSAPFTVDTWVRLVLRTERLAFALPAMT